MSTLQLHVSGLATLSKCGEQFRRRYIEGERTPPSVSMATGTALDRAVSANLSRKLESGVLMAAEEVQDFAREAAIGVYSEGVRATEEDTEAGLEASKGAMVDNSVAAAFKHHEELAPTLEPTHIQRPWVLDIIGLDIQVAGTIDIQEALKTLRDTKFSGKSPVKTMADQSLQLTCYSMAVNAHDGAIPERVLLDYIVRTPKKHETKLVTLSSTRTTTDFNPLLERIAHAEKIIRAGLFTPAPADSWVCSKKYCPYWESCRFAVRPVAVTVE
jgi:hypothetical protein